MSHLSSEEDECFILVKALPHRSSSYFETVCCAGIGRDGKWRRHYPVPFRILQPSQQFGRWSWITYRYSTSLKDRRWESQKVIPESLAVGPKLKESERARFINPLIRPSLKIAAESGESLAMVRPQSITFTARPKSIDELLNEERKHAELARQSSMFDAPVQALKPCSHSFRIKWVGQDGLGHEHECDDWETATAFNRRREQLGEEKAILSLKKTYEEEYIASGVALAFSTHSRRNHQWLLVGIVRIDDYPQADLFMS